MLFVRAYPRETQEMVFDAHNRAFACGSSLGRSPRQCRDIAAVKDAPAAQAAAPTEPARSVLARASTVLG
jgi:hypothetical protein